MDRPITVAVTVALIVATVAAAPAAAFGGGAATAATVQDGESTDDQYENESDVAPGEQLAGIVSVQDAEVEGELDSRAFGLAVARAASDEARAAIVAERMDEIEEKLANAEERKETLDEARENGSMSDGQYRAETAALAADVENVKRMTNETEGAADELPADVLEEQGVNVDALETLRSDADELSGPETAAIAQSIAGPDIGGSIGPSQAGDRGGPGADDADIQQAERQIEQAERQIEQAERQAGGSEDAQAALEDAKAELATAEAALEDARNASASGDQDAVEQQVERALEHAQNAIDAAKNAADTGGAGAETTTTTSGGSSASDNGDSDGR